MWINDRVLSMAEKDCDRLTSPGKDRTEAKIRAGYYYIDVLRRFYSGDDFQKLMLGDGGDHAPLAMLADAQRMPGSGMWVRQCFDLAKTTVDYDIEGKAKEFVKIGCDSISGGCFYSPTISNFLKRNLEANVKYSANVWSGKIGEAYLGGWHEALADGYSYLMAAQIAEASSIDEMYREDQRMEKNGSRKPVAVA